jgi:serine/threonine protein phosphatase PrpC
LLAIPVAAAETAQALLLLFAIPIAGAEKNHSLLLPRDIAFDNAARKALQLIRRKEIQHELHSSGNRDQATMTMVGYKGGRVMDQINQDRAFVMSPYLEGQGMLLGVFDGHGEKGELVSEFMLHELPKRLSQKLELALKETDQNGVDALVKKALMNSFLELDQSTPSGKEGGCTASVVLQLGSKLYVANVGDSISIVATYTTANDRVEVVYVTREDKPELPDEYERILKMGGSVLIPDDPKQDSPRVMYTNPDTGYQSGLAMSRSIGDWDIVGCIAEPIIDVLDVRDLVASAVASSAASDDETCVAAEHVFIFVMSATDGMMDYLRPQDLAALFARAFYRQDGPHPLTVAEDLILKAAKGWNADMEGQYRDDIAVAASKIDVPDEQS